ncbi:hypothetical protein VTO73DRAFT_156 [Trametes versicolor]
MISPPSSPPLALTFIIFIFNYRVSSHPSAIVVDITILALFLHTTRIYVFLMLYPAAYHTHLLLSTVYLLCRSVQVLFLRTHHIYMHHGPCLSRESDTTVFYEVLSKEHYIHRFQRPS